MQLKDLAPENTTLPGPPIPTLSFPLSPAATSLSIIKGAFVLKFRMRSTVEETSAPPVMRTAVEPIAGVTRIVRPATVRSPSSLRTSSEPPFGVLKRMTSVDVPSGTDVSASAGVTSTQSVAPPHVFA